MDKQLVKKKHVILDFATNSNAFMPSEMVKKISKKIYRILNRYPDHTNEELNQAISKFFKIDKNCVCVTNGTMESIEILATIFKKKHLAGLLEPTFWGYKHVLEKLDYNITTKKLNILEDYDLNVLNQIATKSKVIFLCNPNNPTLAYIHKDKLLKIIKKHHKTIFIVDETMLIFSTNYNSETLIKEIKNCRNLSVIVSFSKIFGLAGLRIAAAIASPEIITKIKDKQVLYSTNIVAQELLNVALNDKMSLSLSRKKIKKELDFLENEFLKIGCSTKTGITNFLLVKLPQNIKSSRLTKYLQHRGIQIRDIKESYPQICEEWIRITVGTHTHNVKLLKYIKTYFKMN